MKLKSTSLLIVTFALCACDPASGPFVYNATDHVVHIDVDTGRGVSTVNLKPASMMAAQLGRVGGVLRFLAVIDNGKRREYNRDELEPMLKGVATEGEAFVVLHDDGIEVIHFDDARKRLPPWKTR